MGEAQPGEGGGRPRPRVRRDLPRQEGEEAHAAGPAGDGRGLALDAREDFGPLLLRRVVEPAVEEPVGGAAGHHGVAADDVAVGRDAVEAVGAPRRLRRHGAHDGMRADRDRVGADLARARTQVRADPVVAANRHGRPGGDAARLGRLARDRAGDLPRGHDCGDDRAIDAGVVERGGVPVRAVGPRGRVGHALAGQPVEQPVLRVHRVPQARGGLGVVLAQPLQLREHRHRIVGELPAVTPPIGERRKLRSVPAVGPRGRERRPVLVDEDGAAAAPGEREPDDLTPRQLRRGHQPAQQRAGVRPPLGGLLPRPIALPMLGVALGELRDQRAVDLEGRDLEARRAEVERDECGAVRHARAPTSDRGPAACGPAPSARPSAAPAPNPADRRGRPCGRGACAARRVRCAAGAPPRRPRRATW